MAGTYPRGSEWRKWDLHIHSPGTRLNDGYGGDTEGAWSAFVDSVCASDVVAVGITDYYSLDSFFRAKERFADRDDAPVLFPNLELRLTDAVNSETENVHAHVIFSPDLERADADRLLGRLRTELTHSGDARKLTCNELQANDFAGAMVTRTELEEALRESFGNSFREQALIFVPANNNGIRASGDAQRRANLVDDIDDFAVGIFGGPGNTEYFLDPNRRSDDRKAAAKPVISGCDAHSIEDLRWLGEENIAEEARRYVTWIKADPTFEGLRQIFVEPRGRVRIQASKPDRKEPYKVLRAVRFKDASSFPAEIPLNPNLVSVIGSRSTGKSSLLAYIAYAVDPEYTREQQRNAGAVDEGPAKGMTWEEVESIGCTIEWEATAADEGKVIYVPQNSLYEISERPEEITKKIEPAIYRNDEGLSAEHAAIRSEMQAARDRIGGNVQRWFRLRDRIDRKKEDIAGFGSRAAIESGIEELAARIAVLRDASELTPQEASRYQEVLDEAAGLESTVVTLEGQLADTEIFVSTGSGGLSVELSVHPSTVELPDELKSRVDAYLAEKREDVATYLEELIRLFRQGLESRASDARNNAEQIRSENQELIAKNRANTEIEDLVAAKSEQDGKLAELDGHVADLQTLENERNETIAAIMADVETRDGLVARIVTTFDRADRALYSMTFRIETQLSSNARSALAERVDRRSNHALVGDDGIDVLSARAEVGDFLEAVQRSDIRLKSGEEPEAFAMDVLDMTEEVRFRAEMEGDRIGGFEPSSMTPGKQAIFALTLLLQETEDGWPLLIDQPEDDLDSRSIYDVLVEYLKERKTERQIIMVSHDANLVVGADSEQIVVANRHGSDRPNRDARSFDYLTGSLEDSRVRREADHVLERAGIREHACDILDGGEEAFRKRREKYQIA